MGAVLICWRQQVHRQHRTNRLVAQRVQQTKLQLLRAVMTEWCQLAQTQQRKAAIMARCQRKHAAHLLQQGLFAFSAAVAVRKTRTSIVEVVSSKAKVSRGSIICMSTTVAWATWGTYLQHFWLSSTHQMLCKMPMLLTEQFTHMAVSGLEESVILLHAWQQCNIKYCCTPCTFL